MRLLPRGQHCVGWHGLAVHHCAGVLIVHRFCDCTLVLLVEAVDHYRLIKHYLPI